MRLFNFIILGSLILGTGCKKSADTAVALVPERLEINMPSFSVLVNEAVTLSVSYYDVTGRKVSTPTGVVWSSLDPAIIFVGSNGLVKGLSAGQGKAQVKYNNAVATALISVAENNQQLATVIIMPVGVQQLQLNQTATLTATGKTNNDNTIPGLSFNWQSNDNALVSVTAAGVVTGKKYGTALVTATAMNIQSAPIMVQVIRSGPFSGSGSSGKAVLKIENNVLKLETSSDFTSSTGAPDLRIYLTNNTSSVNNAVEIATLNQRNGAQVWNIPSAFTITQFRYALIWCKQFGGNYGVADLGM